MTFVADSIIGISCHCRLLWQQDEPKGVKKYGSPTESVGGCQIVYPVASKGVRAGAAWSLLTPVLMSVAGPDRVIAR